MLTNLCALGPPHQLGTVNRPQALALANPIKYFSILVHFDPPICHFIPATNLSGKSMAFKTGER
jgi:hypothetical protein